MLPTKLESLKSLYRDGLLNDVLPFWLHHAVDHEHGGFLTCLDRDGTVLDTDKGMWQQGRFTWLLSHLCHVIGPNDEWLNAARSGIHFLRQHGFDSDGRMWFHVTRDGRPLRKRRYIFTECFAVMAFAAYARVAQDEQARQDAHQLRRAYQHWLQTPGALTAKFTETRPTKSIGVPMIEIGVSQALRDCLDDNDRDEHEALNQVIDRCIDEIERDFVKDDLAAVMETVSSDGQVLDHFGGRTLNPGHAIEAAWFILQEGQIRQLPRYVRLGLKMLDWMWARGWDDEYGGIYYFRDIDERPVAEYWHDMKFWWPHNETIIATLLAFLASGDTKYAQWHGAVHDWSYTHFPDAIHGEWFGYLHRDGRLSVPLKGNLWKGPFHLPRMQLVCSLAIERATTSQ